MDVLVVENDVSELSSIVKLVQRWGHSAEMSDTGQSALDKVSEKMFDLVLLDTSLTDITAQDLITKLKELRPDIGIITMTGSSNTDLEREIRTLGIIYYMSKPVDKNVLKDIVDHISRKKEEQNE